MFSKERLPQLRVLFQPICLPDGHLVYGNEAFISDQWGTPATDLYEQAHQSQSVPLLEKVGFTKICREFSRNKVGGKLFLNIFAETLSANILSVETILENFKRFEIEPSHTVIEFQELVPISNLSRLKAATHRLCEEGVQIALDGFGFGYSNLGRLFELQPNYIKVDARYFLEEEDPKKLAVLSSLQQMCTYLNICMIAKNIETAAMANNVRSKTAMQLLQGDYFGRPQRSSNDDLETPSRDKVKYREVFLGMATPILYGRP